MSESPISSKTSFQSRPGDEVLRRRRKSWLRAIWISIAGVIVPPMFGIIGTVFSMLRAFGDASKNGGSDPGTLSKHISAALVSTASGLAISVISFMILIAALIRFFRIPKPGEATGDRTGD